MPRTKEERIRLAYTYVYETNTYLHEHFATVKEWIDAEVFVNAEVWEANDIIRFLEWMDNNDRTN